MRDVLHATIKAADVIDSLLTPSRADLLIAVNVALLSVNGYNVYRKIKYSSPPPPSPSSFNAVGDLTVRVLLCGRACSYDKQMQAAQAHA